MYEGELKEGVTLRALVYLKAKSIDIDLAPKEKIEHWKGYNDLVKLDAGDMSATRSVSETTTAEARSVLPLYTDGISTHPVPNTSSAIPRKRLLSADAASNVEARPSKKRVSQVSNVE